MVSSIYINVFVLCVFFYFFITWYKAYIMSAEVCRWLSVPLCLFACLYVVLFVCALNTDMWVVHIHFNRCYERNHSNFFCRLDMYIHYGVFLSKLKSEENGYSVAFQANLIPHVYTIHVTICSMNIVTPYPRGDNFSFKNTCASKTLAHEPILIPSIPYACILHFPIVSISNWSRIFLVEGLIFDNVKNLLG